MKEKEVVAYKGNYRKFIIIYFFISIILLAICAGFIIYIDPFYHYHAPLGKMQLIQEKEAYQNVGIARNCKYDAILTGSSMTENFKISQLNELFDCDTVKLSFSGGRIPNYITLFDQALKNKNIKIKKIFYGCDLPAYIDDPTAEIPNKIPEYLYDDNMLTDVKYIFNKTALFEYAYSFFKYDIKNIEVQNPDEVYSWYNLCDFSKAGALSQYERPKNEEKKDSNLYAENVKQNCEKIGKYIKENQEIEFNIFFPPYSILFYDMHNREGDLEAIINGQEMLAEYLIQFPNVKLSAFSTEKDIICNLDNYKDYSHYLEKINEYIAEKMKRESKLLNKDNYKEYFSNAREFFMNYNYDEIFY